MLYRLIQGFKGVVDNFAVAIQNDSAIFIFTFEDGHQLKVRIPNAALDVMTEAAALSTIHSVSEQLRQLAEKHSNTVPKFVEACQKLASVNNVPCIDCTQAPDAFSMSITLPNRFAVVASELHAIREAWIDCKRLGVIRGYNVGDVIEGMQGVPFTFFCERVAVPPERN